MCMCVSWLNDGEEAFIKSRAHVRDRKGYSINLRVQAYSCHLVRGRRGEGGRDTDLKAFSPNNGCPVFWKKARSSQFIPPHPFLSLFSHCSQRLFSSLCLLPFLRLPRAWHTSTNTTSTFHTAPFNWSYPSDSNTCGIKRFLCQ